MSLLKTADDIIVDALFGIGLRLPLRAAAAKVLAQVNAHASPNLIAGQVAGIQAGRAPRSASPNARGVLSFWLSIAPAASTATAASADADALSADATISFHRGETGPIHFSGGSAIVGDLAISTLGLPEELSRIVAVVGDR